MGNIEDQLNSNNSGKSLEIIPSQKLLMGVCFAFGTYIKFNPVFVRLIVLLAFIFIGQPIILIYSAFGILLPMNETPSNEYDNLSNKLSINILVISGLILLILLQTNLLTLKSIFNFSAERVDSFSLLVFSIALIINSYYKESVKMKEQNFKSLTLSDKKIIFGVCGGLAEYLNVSPNLIRIIWIIFGIASFGTAILIYIILRFIIPQKIDHSKYDVE